MERASIQEINRMLESKEINLQREALRQIKFFQHYQFLPEVRAAMYHQDDEVRFGAVLALTSLAISDTLDMMEANLKSDTCALVRSISAFAIRQANRRANTEALFSALHDDDERVITSAIATLSDTSYDRIAHQFLSLLNHDSWNIRHEACVALVKMKFVTPEVITSINKLMTAPEAVDYEQMVIEQIELNQSLEVELKELGEEVYPNPDQRLTDLLRDAEQLLLERIRDKE